MKRLILVTGLVAALAFPIVAQSVDGPIQLRNPHRRGADTPTTEPTATSSLFSIQGNKLVPIDASAMPAVAPPSVAMVADGPYLFVLRGDSLYQFDKKTLKLTNSTQLPSPTTQAELKTHTSPPLRPGTEFKSSP